jgi:hypothetical protein
MNSEYWISSEQNILSDFVLVWFGLVTSEAERMFRSVQERWFRIAAINARKSCTWFFRTIEFSTNERIHQLGLGSNLGNLNSVLWLAKQRYDDGQSAHFIIVGILACTYERDRQTIVFIRMFKNKHINLN